MLSWSRPLARAFFRAALQHRPRQRFRLHQQDRRPIAPSPIFAESELLTLPARDAIFVERALMYNPASRDRPLISAAASLVCPELGEAHRSRGLAGTRGD